MREPTKREKEVGELGEQGFTVTQIAEKLGIVEGTVRQHYRNYKRRMNIPRKIQITERQEQVADLKNRGLTFKEIGEELNITGNAASQLYRKYLSNQRRLLKNKEEYNNG